MDLLSFFVGFVFANTLVCVVYCMLRRDISGRLQTVELRVNTLDCLLNKLEKHQSIFNDLLKFEWTHDDSGRPLATILFPKSPKNKNGAIMRRLRLEPRPQTRELVEFEAEDTEPEKKQTKIL